MGEARRSRGWVWFFVVLAVLTVAAVVGLVTYNLRQQLTPEKLAQAEALWRQKGPRDYDLEYTEQGSISGTYRVEVRDGRVVSAEPDDRPLAQKRPYYGMPALFGFVEDFLEEDAKPGAPRTFTVAAFDPEDGHLVHYVRRVMGTSQRLEIDVHFRRVEKGTPAEGADTTREARERPGSGG